MEMRGVGGDESLLPRRSIHLVRSATIVRTGKENDGRHIGIYT